ncbi:MULTISPECIES: type II secretion system protein GspM [Rhizobium]|uniref:type II secretion system protein GspM n=1 Tax=Rhizobium TaxID=379 RepID=UPI001B32B96A|nr:MULTISPECIES: type II secretion system protein GspM [Rhizobium]MBX4907033.1 hypothetical protein [Rhizobium bangladeshense]MBX5232791.1 hypothetical protein [Rhizobium sp. NLR4a]MBX5242733.1 hypothetical protein [Rhizobium sp. NLR22b]MBX5254857.1 hypothetical protein [Rhizobium sp. NLR4b]MBX5256147.1 hypothetical protein [Rhizobium sp. NLR16b]
MTDLLIGLMNAPQRVQQMVAFGLLAFGTLCVIWISVLTGDQLRGLASDIDAKRFELGKLNAILSRRPLDGASTAISADVAAALYLQGDTMPVTRARLQERINAIAGEAGAVVISISVLSESSRDGVPLIGVTADIQGSLSSVHRAMVGIETSRPPLVIRKATIRATNPIQQGQLQAPLQLSTSMEIYGSVNPATSGRQRAAEAK